MSQRRTTFQMMGERGGGGGQYGNIDTTYTKIFVGGLAWETQRETMRHYFAQFGEIHEAVVITDKNTGRSKGYGFVTFRDPEAAIRACENPNPIIDGRRANCNLASLGAQKPQNPPIHPQHGVGRFRLASGLTTPPAAYQGSSSTPYFHLSNSQYTFPYSPYGYRFSGYPQDSIYPVNYYNIYGGGQQFQPYYAPGSTGPPGIFQNYIPYYPLAQHSQSHGLGVQYPHQMLQMPYLPQQPSSMGLLSVPSSNSVAVSTTSSTGVSVTASSAVAGGTSQPTGTVSENNSST